MNWTVACIVHHYTITCIHPFLHVFMKLTRFTTTETIPAHSPQSAIKLPAKEVLPALRHWSTDCVKTRGSSVWLYCVLPLSEVTQLWCTKQPPTSCEAEPLQLPACWDTPRSFHMPRGYFPAAWEQQTGTENSSDPFSQYPLNCRAS